MFRFNLTLDNLIKTSSAAADCLVHRKKDKLNFFFLPPALTDAASLAPSSGYIIWW